MSRRKKKSDSKQFACLTEKRVLKITLEWAQRHILMCCSSKHNLSSANMACDEAHLISKLPGKSQWIPGIMIRTLLCSLYLWKISMEAEVCLGVFSALHSRWVCEEREGIKLAGSSMLLCKGWKQGVGCALAHPLPSFSSDSPRPAAASFIIQQCSLLRIVMFTLHK